MVDKYNTCIFSTFCCVVLNKNLLPQFCMLGFRLSKHFRGGERKTCQMKGR